MPGPVDGSGSANGSEPVNRRGWSSDEGDTDLRADYRVLPGHGGESAGRGPRQPSGGRYESQSSEDEYLHGRVLPPNTYPPSADYGGRQDYPGYNFGQANWQERRDGARGGPQTGDGYRPRLSEDFEAAAGGWSMPRRRSGYSPEAAGGYGRVSDGEFQRAPDEGQWPPDGARWPGDGGARWSGDGNAQWSGDGTARGYDVGRAGSGPRFDGDYIAAPDGRYAPRPDMRLPEPSRPELALPELPRPELARPEPALPELPRPDARLAESPRAELEQSELPRPEVAQPEPALPELPRPGARLAEPSRSDRAQPEPALPELPRPDARLAEPSRSDLARPDLALPELPHPDARLAEPSRSDLARPDLALPELPRPDYDFSQLAGFGGESSRRLDSPMPNRESGHPAPSGPRTDEVRSSVVLPESPVTGLGRAAEGRDEVVPAQNGAAGNAANLEAGGDDDTVTAPLPAILPGAISVPRPDPAEAPRGFFEPPQPGSSPGRPASVTGSVEPPPVDYAVPVAPRPMAPGAEAKLDQLKDLYLTAEAIGEDALDKHFDQVSQRQRELIKELFQRSNSSGPDAG